MSGELDDIASKMMHAIEDNDLAVMHLLNHDDVAIWHNFDGIVQNKADNIALLGGIALLGKASYHIFERICVSDRIIQRHELIITTWDGSREYRLPAAIFMTVRDGRIVAVEEYADSRGVDEIAAAIGKAAAASPSSPEAPQSS